MIKSLQNAKKGKGIRTRRIPVCISAEEPMNLEQESKHRRQENTRKTEHGIEQKLEEQPSISYMSKVGFDHSIEFDGAHKKH